MTGHPVHAPWRGASGRAGCAVVPNPGGAILDRLNIVQVVLYVKTIFQGADVARRRLRGLDRGCGWVADLRLQAGARTGCHSVPSPVEPWLVTRISMPMHRR